MSVLWVMEKEACCECNLERGYDVEEEQETGIPCSVRG